MLKKLVAVVFVLAFAAACQKASVDKGAAGVGGATTAPAAQASTIVPGSQADLEANVGDRVFFDLDKSTLSADAQATLGRQAAWMQANPQVKVTVEGHCDERGTREYNLALGERRAAAAKKFLVNAGVDAARVATISYGKERPAATGSTDEAFAQNRRAVTVVTQ